RNIRVLQFGVGAVGRETIRQLAMRGIELVGAVDLDPALAGKDAGLVAGLGKRLGIAIESDLEDCLKRTQPQVVLHATGFVAKKMLEDFTLMARHQVHVVSISGIAYIWKRHPELAAALHDVALQHKVAFVGAGMIPALLSAAQPEVYGRACHGIRTLAIRRSAVYFTGGPLVMARNRVGLQKATLYGNDAADDIMLFSSQEHSVEM